MLSLLAQWIAPEAVLDDCPDLELDDIRASTAYAHAVIVCWSRGESGVRVGW